METDQETMKAVIWSKYGGVDALVYSHLAKPGVRKDQVLVKIVAATVTAGDCELRKFDMPGLWWLPVRIAVGVFKPRIPVLGQEYSGIIEEVGEEVTRFQAGDEIVVLPAMGMGGYAQYKALKPRPPMMLKPKNFTFEEAATLPTGGMNAIYFLKRANINHGEKLLIIGAGGSIGTYGIQIARHMGAHITAIDTGAKLDTLKKLGADEVIDYQKTNFTKQDLKYDVIFEVAGEYGFRKVRRCLKPGGRYLIANPGVRNLMGAMLTNLFSNYKVIIGVTNEPPGDMQKLIEYADQGVIKPHIDRRFDLKDIREAHEYVEANKKTGSVIINIPQD